MELHVRHREVLHVFSYECAPVLRCHFTKVSGWTTTSASCQSKNPGEQDHNSAGRGIAASRLHLALLKQSELLAKEEILSEKRCTG